MTIPVIQYKGFELRSHSSQVFPSFHDPHASGVKRFASIVRIDTLPLCVVSTKRYSTACAGIDRASAVHALSLAMQYGENITNSEMHPEPL